MSKARWEARLGACAFMVGLSWVGLQSAGAADADTAGSGSPQASTSAGPAKRHTATVRPGLSTPKGSAVGVTRRTTPKLVARPRPIAAPKLPAVSLPGAKRAASANPVQAFFDGVLQQIRRTFFNQAPTVNPVQITGGHDGVITGTIGAVDPEGDPIKFKLKSAVLPEYGSVAIASDGTFTFKPGPLFEGTAEFTVTATDLGAHINLLNLFRAPSTAALVRVEQDFTPCTVCIHVDFTYGAGADLWTPEVRAALQTAARILAFYITVTSPVTLTYNVIADAESSDNPKATGGSPYYDASKGFNETVVQHKILTGVDGNGQSPDGEIWWNFAAGLPEQDPVPVALHELVHTLGFASSLPDLDEYWLDFDSFIVTSDGAHPISSSGKWNSAYTPNLSPGYGGLFFAGTNAVAAYGEPVPLWTGGVEDASSYSHLDGTRPGLRNLLMSVFYTALPRALSAVELAILEDLGYTVNR
ncbi:hypothetical protein MycrhDRAFT_6683 [Mycolicibacterium rhodesiae JS60]|nr:hypothetical protein MycrhDRAFT_6683 [Mycolicibacterium rhodesiae JS60]